MQIRQFKCLNKNKYVKANPIADYRKSQAVLTDHSFFLQVWTSKRSDFLVQMWNSSILWTVTKFCLEHWITPIKRFWEMKLNRIVYTVVLAGVFTTRSVTYTNDSQWNFFKRKTTYRVSVKSASHHNSTSGAFFPRDGSLLKAPTKG